MALNIQTITTSTSVLFVNPTEIQPNIPVVLLSSLNSFGRIMTVRDGDGGSRTNPIFVSTTRNIKFQDGTTSLVKIQQPYGFVTFSAVNNNTYNLLNTYAFPDATDTAYYNFLNANLIAVSSISTNSMSVVGRIDFTNPVFFYSSLTAYQGVTSEDAISTLTLGVRGDATVYNKTRLLGPVGVLCNDPRFDMDISGSLYTAGLYAENTSLSTSVLSNSYIQNLSAVTTVASNMYIGNIPTLDPAFVLDVAGRARISTLSTYSLGVQNASFISSQTGSAVITNANITRLSNVTAQISSLGINTATPAFRLDVNGNSRVSSIQGNVIATLAYTSTLGIQTTAPKFPLDVNGVINSASSIQSRSVYTSSITATTGAYDTTPRFLIGGQGGRALGLVVNSTIVPIQQNILTFIVGIMHDGMQYVAGGTRDGGDGTEAVVATSKDGRIWTQAGFPQLYSVNSFFYAKGKYLFSARFGISSFLLRVSSDLVNWESVFPHSSTSFQTRKFAFNGTTILIIGKGASSEPQTFVSEDGITWTAGQNLDDNFLPLDVVWNGSIWCMTGVYLVDDPAKAFVFATSKNGLQWTKSRAYIFKDVNTNLLYGGAITWTGTQFIAGNQYGGSDNIDSRVAFSTDGMTWTTTDINDYKYYAIATNGSQILAVGTSFVTTGLNSVYLFDANIGSFVSIDTDSAFFLGGGRTILPITYSTDTVIKATGKVTVDTLNTIGPAQIQGQLQVGGALQANPLYNNVGVNCNAPAYTLDVGGTMHTSFVRAEEQVLAKTVSTGFAYVSSLHIGTAPKTTSRFILDVSGKTHVYDMISDYDVITRNVCTGTFYASTIILSQEGVNNVPTPYQLNVKGSASLQSLSTLFVSTGIVDMNRFTLFDDTQSQRFFASTGGLFYSSNQQILTVNGTGETALGRFFGSTVTGLGTASYVSTASLTSTVRDSIQGVASTVVGLGTVGYVSTASLTSTVRDSIQGVASTVVGLGTVGYLSSLSNVRLLSTVSGFFSSIAVGCNAPRFQVDVNGSLNATTIDSRLVSTWSVLTSSVRIFDGSSNYPLNANNGELYWNTSKIVTTGGASGGVVQSDLTSTVRGLGTTGYVSSLMGVTQMSSLQGIFSSIGIGSNRPAYNLDVTGSAKASQLNVFKQPSQRLIIAVGACNTTFSNNILYSYDGLNWNPQSNLFSRFVNAVENNGSMWVAVGENTTANNQTIKYSYDGFTWCNASNAFSDSGSAVAWNGRMWVAGGYTSNTSNSLKYSYNGVNWSDATGVRFTLNSQGIIWDGTKWIAVGNQLNPAPPPTYLNAPILISYDGITWSQTGFINAGVLNWDVKYNGNIYLIGRNGGITYSYDGLNWTDSTTVTTSVSCRNLAWNGNLWVAVFSETTANRSNSIRYSYNGLQWFPASNVFDSSIGGGGYTIGFGVTWTGSMFLATGGDDNSNARIKYSYDGINWSNSASGVNLAAGLSFGFTKNNTPDIATDNLNFYLQRQPNFLTSTNQILATQSSIIVNETLTVDKTNRVGINSGTPQYNLDVTGTAKASQLNVFKQPSQQLYILGGVTTATSNSAAYSYDGINWIQYSNIGFTLRTESIKHNGTMWVAVGANSPIDSTNIKYSYDGFTWNNATNGFTNGYGVNIAWNGRMWLAGGNSSNSSNSIKYSYDGINWSNATGVRFNNEARGFIWDGTKWIAAGTQLSGNTTPILVSPDGITWSQTGTANSIYAWDVQYNGYIYLLTHDGGMMYSYDGFNWNTVANLVTSIGSRVLGWNGNMWVGGFNELNVSNAYTIRYSYDGLTWYRGSNTFGPGATFNTVTFDIQWTSNLWLASGMGSNNTLTIKYSYDGINWSNGSGGFSNQSYKIGFTVYNTPDIATDNLNFYLQRQPNFLTSTNQILTTQSSIIVNETLTVDKTNRVGINSGTPQYNLDVTGTAKVNQLSVLNTPPSLWVAAGTNSPADSNTLKFSYDGFTWYNALSGGYTNTALHLCWNGSIWVAYGADTFYGFKYSYDGKNWLNSASTPFTNGLYRIATNGRMFVAVGNDTTSNNAIKYSFDGITWSNSKGSGYLPAGGISYARGVGWNGSYWLAVGGSFGITDSNVVKYSYDGVTWSSTGIPVGNTGGGYNVAWNGNLWVMVGSDSDPSKVIWYSSNGFNWTKANAYFSNAGAEYYAFNVSFNGSYFLASGPESRPTYRIQKSYDGINWTPANFSAFNTANAGTLDWDGTKWIAAFGLSNLGYSYDGSNWTQITNNAFTGASMASYAKPTTPDITANNLNFYLQKVPNFTSTNQITAYESTLAINNTVFIDSTKKVGIQTTAPQYNLDVTGSAKVNQLNVLKQPSGQLYIAGGANYPYNSNTMAYSYDGINWGLRTGVNNYFTRATQKILNNGSMWVAVGLNSPIDSNTIKYSYDGFTWFNANNGFTDSGLSLGWNGRMWIAVGGGGVANSNTIKYSSDGVTWSNVTGTRFTNQGWGVTWDGTKWIASGNQSSGSTSPILISYDGITWSQTGTVTYTGFDVQYNGNIYLIGGDTGISYSYNGTTWLSNTITTTSVSCRQLAWNGSLWVAVFSETNANRSNSIRYSYNGLQWYPASNVFDSSPDSYTIGGGVVWTGSMWLAGGTSANSNATMKYSYDGINWCNTSGFGFVGSTYPNVGGGGAFGFIANNTPDIATDRLNFYFQNQPSFLTSTAQISADNNSVLINNSLRVFTKSLGYRGTYLESIAAYGQLKITGGSLENSIYISDSNTYPRTDVANTLNGWMLGQSSNFSQSANHFGIWRVNNGNVQTTTGLAIQSDGYVGIGTNAPDVQFSVVNPTSNLAAIHVGTGNSFYGTYGRLILGNCNHGIARGLGYYNSLSNPWGVDQNDVVIHTAGTGGIVFVADSGSATTTAAKRMFIKNNGFVGINTPAPIAPLDVLNSFMAGVSNSAGAYGKVQVFGPTTGTGKGDNFIQIWDSNQNPSTQGGGTGWCIGNSENFRPGTPGHFAINRIFAGVIYGGQGINIDSDGRVGIGTNSPGWLLTVNGSAAKPGGGTWSDTSDRRIKENIVLADTNWCISTVKNINLYHYNFIESYYKTYNLNDKSMLGFIAQEVSSFFPKSVSPISTLGLDDCLTLDATQILYTQYGATKRLIERVESLEAEVDQLKSTLQAVLAKVAL